MTKSSAANNPTELEPKYYGETRNAHGYDYWTTSEEDEDSLNIREQVAAGTLDVKKKKKKRKKLLAPGAGRRTIFRFIGLGLLLAIVGLAYTVFNFVQISDAAAERSQEPADAILVIGDAESTSAPSNELQERLDHAFTLFGNDAGSLIITTVANPDGESSDAGEAGRDHLLRRGISAGALAQVAEGNDPWDQISAAAATLEDRNLSSLLIVADSHQNYRVLQIADALGVDAAVSPSLRAPSFSDKVREAVTVGIGRLAGFDRVRNLSE